MVYRKPHQRDKDEESAKSRGRPRGKPFSKGYEPHNKGKSNSTLLDDSGHQNDLERTDVRVEPNKSIGEPAMHEIKPPDQPIVPAKIIEHGDSISLTKADEETKDQIMERIDFMNGNDKLSIIFSKRHNRSFRIQVFLNDTTEIRPTNYTGALTGYGFWNLLKGAMKK